MNNNEKLCVSLAVIATTALLIKRYAFSNKSNIPLVPYRFPWLGSTIDYYTNTLEFTKKYSEMYGSVFRMHLHGRIVAVVGANDATEVFTHPDLSFLAGQVEFLGKATAGRKVKKVLLTPEDMKKSIVKHLTPNLEYYCPRSFEMFVKKANTVLGDETVVVPDLTSFLRSFVSFYSARAFVGKDLCDDKDLMNAFENSVNDISQEIKPGLLRVIFPSFNTIYMELFYPFLASIEKHRTLIKTAISKQVLKDNNEQNGIMGYLLEEHPIEIDDDYLEGLTTIVLVFIFVGVHTTTMAMTQVMYRIVKHPEYIEELLKEQKELVDPKDPQTYTPTAYRQMHKLDSFIRESMRMSNTGIGLPHKNITNHDVVLKSGAVVKPNENVYINMWHVHINQDNQGIEDPERFEGFRFLDKDKTVTKPGNDFLSFGFGRNACPGRWFAIQQIKGLVSFFLNNYEMKAIGEIKIPGADGYSGLISGTVEFKNKKVLKVSNK